MLSASDWAIGRNKHKERKKYSYKHLDLLDKLGGRNPHQLAFHRERTLITVWEPFFIATVGYMQSTPNTNICCCGK